MRFLSLKPVAGNLGVLEATAAASRLRHDSGAPEPVSAAPFSRACRLRAIACMPSAFLRAEVGVPDIPFKACPVKNAGSVLLRVCG